MFLLFFFFFYSIFVFLLCVHEELDNNSNKLWKHENKTKLNFLLLADSGGLIFSSSLTL